MQQIKNIKWHKMVLLKEIAIFLCVFYLSIYCQSQWDMLNLLKIYNLFWKAENFKKCSVSRSVPFHDLYSNTLSDCIICTYIRKIVCTNCPCKLKITAQYRKIKNYLDMDPLMGCSKIT